MTTTAEASIVAQGANHGSQPQFHQHGQEIQAFGTVRRLPIALALEARAESCQLLNQLLADSQILFSLYKKHHWLMRGHTFYQLHLLLDKHAGEQLALIDTIAERIQTLGGVAVGDPRHVAEITKINRPPNGVEEVPVMLSRLLDAHETIITGVRDAIERTARTGDAGSNDLLMSDVLRTHETQVWFLAEHLKENGVQPTGSILVVDREPTIVDLLVEILTDAGYIAYTAPDGAGARVAIARHRPALILLDVGHPGMNGAALIEHVCAADPAIIPIVLMTTAPCDAAPLLVLGAGECLAKPFNLDELLACVARYVQPDHLPNQFAFMDARSAVPEQ